MSFGQGGPQWGSGGQHHDPYNSRQGAPDSFNPFGAGRGAQDPDTPDWAALAEASAARTRRKRWLLIGGGALATAAVAGIVATAIVSSNDSGDNRSKEKSSSRAARPREPAERHQRARAVLLLGRPGAPAEPQGLRLQREEGQGPAERRHPLPRQEADDGRPRPTPRGRRPAPPVVPPRCRVVSGQSSHATAVTRSSAPPTARTGWPSPSASPSSARRARRRRPWHERRARTEPRPAGRRGRQHLLQGRPGLPLHGQLLRPVRVLHQHRLHHRQGRRDGRHQGVPEPATTSPSSPSGRSWPAAMRRPQQQPSRPPADSGSERLVARLHVAGRQQLVGWVADLLERQPVRPYDMDGRVPYPRGQHLRRPLAPAGARRRRTAARPPASAPCCGRRHRPARSR